MITIDMVLILVLVAFIAGLIVGVSMMRPNVYR
jgi:hypothetical protein